MNAEKILLNQRLSKLFRLDLLTLSPESAAIQTLGEDADPAQHPSIEPFFGSRLLNPGEDRPDVTRLNLRLRLGRRTVR